ncbi:hypothetical protein Lnau_0970 [Legionella nautarum]|uniref:Glycosyltransferase RgtA/B/C/D-like domain-containing protein n=1 Tax=Legionella nautarum TaxID=45070 RepID=A0A0W0WUK5_9GAMM|nr:hypothetical protein [Legionella nautarum]KTD35986.1 hypothetical protein Lnau_0970 [Legionella nautarum]
MARLLHLIKSKNCFFIAFLIMLLGIFIERITIGVDLSDEAYYATHLDSWLKEGIKNSSNLMIHQSAALLLFPFVYVYQNLVSHELGLILFLRFVYMLMALGAMLSLYFFIKPLRGQLLAALVLAFGFLFIPWSLPAPSYNTIGMYGMLAAMSIFGIALMQKPGKKSLSPMLSLLSAFLWTCTIVAYPSLIIVFSGFIAIAFSLLKERRIVFYYFLFCGFLFVAALASLLIILGVDHCIQIFKFTNAALQISGGLSAKFHKIYEQIFQSPIFAILCATSLSLGVIVAIYPRLLFLAELYLAGVIFYLTFFGQTVLFLISHDIILIIALFGVFIPFTAIKQARNSSIYAILALMYCTSLFAGLITTITASNGLLNFPIGGLLAACLTLAFTGYEETRKSGSYALIFVLILSAFSMGFIVYKNNYGEINNSFPTEKISEGVFAGLKTSVQQADFIHKVSSVLPQDTKAEKITVLGRLSGFYLLTSLAPSALATWNYQFSETNLAGQMISQFYQEKKNQPCLIAAYSDPWTGPLTDREKSLLKNYRFKIAVESENRVLRVFQNPVCSYER